MDAAVTDESCPFCQRIRVNDVHATPDPRVIRFAPLSPVTPGHLLFVPRKHVPSAAADPWLAGVTFQAAAAYAAARPGDYNLITSAGPAATQTIMHLHVHLVPRTMNDGLPLPWTPQQAALRT